MSTGNKNTKKEESKDSEVKAVSYADRLRKNKDLDAVAEQEIATNVQRVATEFQDALNAKSTEIQKIISDLGQETSQQKLLEARMEKYKNSETFSVKEMIKLDGELQEIKTRRKNLIKRHELLVETKQRLLDWQTEMLSGETAASTSMEELFANT